MELFDLALQSTIQEFHGVALRWMETRIEFDGVIQGLGERDVTAPITMNQFLLSARANEIIPDDSGVALVDAVSTRFFEAPDSLAEHFDARRVLARGSKCNA